MNSLKMIEEIKQYVEEECKKPTSKYGYEPYNNHFIPTQKYARELAKRLNADMEIVELAALLHDIGSIVHGRVDHHITGAEIAEEKLKEVGYPQDRIDKVKHCILTHRGSKSIKRETVEAQILADADAMSAFDSIAGLFKAAYVYENLTQEQAGESVAQKLKNSWEKLSPEAKDIIRDKYEAAKVIFRL